MKYIDKKSGEVYSLTGTEAGKMILTHVDTLEQVSVPAVLLNTYFLEKKEREQEEQQEAQEAQEEGEDTGGKYAAQRRHLAKMKIVKTTIPPELYEAFVERLEAEGASVYGKLKAWIVEYTREGRG